MEQKSGAAPPFYPQLLSKTATYHSHLLTFNVTALYSNVCFRRAFTMFCFRCVSICYITQAMVLCLWVFYHQLTIM